MVSPERKQYAWSSSSNEVKEFLGYGEQDPPLQNAIVFSEDITNWPKPDSRRD